MFFTEAGIEQIIVAAGYAGVFGLMIANGVFSFPSSQILYIISGYFVFTGDLALFLVTFLGALGNTIGNYILFALTRNRGVHYITKLTLIPEVEIRKIQVVFAEKGAWFLFIGKLLPALKVFVPIMAGIGKVRSALFIPIVFASSYLWALGFVAIGFYFGKSSDFFGKYAFVIMIVAFVVMGLFYKYMNSKKVLEKIEKADNVSA